MSMGRRFLICRAKRYYSFQSRKNIFFAFVSCMLFIATSCGSSQTTVSFLNNDNDVQIFINDEYVGTGLVSYTFPKEVTTAEVECKRDGSVIFRRNYNIKGLNHQLLELNIPNNLYYSSDIQTKSK